MSPLFLAHCIIKRTIIISYVTLNFCPNNVAVSHQDGKLYFIDLKDVEEIAQLKNPSIIKILFDYNPYDYLEKIISSSNSILHVRI